MEHLSRRTVDDLDLLLLVSDQTSLGIRTAANLLKTAKHVKLNMKKIGLVVSRAKGELTSQQMDIIKKEKIELLGVVPEDENIYQLREDGKSLLELRDDNDAVEVVNLILKNAGV